VRAALVLREAQGALLHIHLVDHNANARVREPALADAEAGVRDDRDLEVAALPGAALEDVRRSQFEEVS